MNKKISIWEGRVLNIDGLPKTESAIRDIGMLPEVERAFINQKVQTFLHSKYVFLNYPKPYPSRWHPS